MIELSFECALERRAITHNPLFCGGEIDQRQVESDVEVNRNKEESAIEVDWSKGRLRIDVVV